MATLLPPSVWASGCGVAKRSVVLSLPRKSLLLLTASALLVSVHATEATEVCDLVHNVSCPAIDGGLFFTDEQRAAGTGLV